MIFNRYQFILSIAIDNPIVNIIIIVKEVKVLKNAKIREQIKQAGVFQYEVAETLGITEMTLIRWLRKPLSADTEKRITTAIAKTQTEKEA